MYYFFKTIKEKEKLRVVALEKQIDNSGKAIDTKFRVSCSKDIRDRYPVGTIFVGDCIKLSKSGTYYTTKNFRKLNISEKIAAAEYEKLTGIKVKGESLYEVISKDSKLQAPTSTEDGFYVSQGDWNILVRNIKQHINTLIVGGAGWGKTSVVKKACDKMGLPLHVFDMGSMVDPISSLLGVHRLEKGESVFDYAKFTQVIQEPCVILLDELSRASYAAMNILFPCLDDRRSLSIEIASGKGVRDIKVHPEVTFVATANVGAEYTGTNSMDRALTNRFFPLELGIIPQKEEEEVLKKRYEIDAKTANLIVKVASNIRSLASKSEISSSLSIRETLMVANLVSDGWDLGQAMEMIYLPLYEGTKTEGERSTIYKTISSY